MSAEVVRILLIEDNAGDARLLREMFSAEKPGSFELTHVLRMSDGVTLLEKGETDIVLVDMGLPDEHGLATVRRVNEAAPLVPVIVLTGLDDETLAAEAIQAGAEDYLIKGKIESRALPRALRYAIERRRLRMEAELVRTHQIEFKEEFLSHVSHELRSPLTAIYQFVTILLDGLSGELTAPQRQCLEVVSRNVDQLRVMIDDLLEISRVQTGKLIVDLRSTSMTEAVAYAMTTLEGAATAKAISLGASNLDHDLPQIYADPARMRQILVILLDNAIKFTPPQGSVSVRAKRSEDNPDFVVVEVSDSGCGIRPDMTELIFERQFQADPALQGRRGLGLGLFICKDLVTRQGGRIWATNRPEGGAVFTVSVPVMSLPALIAPLITAEDSRDALALVIVESTPDKGWASDAARLEWSRDSRALVKGCLLRVSDRVLPQTDSGGPTEVCFAVASGSGHGVAVLVRRIREQFSKLEAVQQLGVSVSVSSRFISPVTATPSADATAHTIADLISAETDKRSVPK